MLNEIMESKAQHAAEHADDTEMGEEFLQALTDNFKRHVDISG